MSNFLLKNPDCVLIHVPKSAGRSIRMGVWDGQYEGPYFGPLPPELKKYFAFAFVRNPYDRLVSVWRMFSEGVKETKGYQYRWKPNPKLTIGDVLDITENDRIIYDERRSNFEEILKHHSIPMSHPFNALDDADYIGRYENIESDWEYICGCIGLKRVKLPRLNYTAKVVGGNLDYRQYFDSSLRKRVETIYADDFAKFNYEF